MLNSNIILGEILNPQIYTGITERDFHLYNLDKDRMPNYVHIEPDSILLKEKTLNFQTQKNINMNMTIMMKNIKFMNGE